jgi:hypothetical protein
MFWDQPHQPHRTNNSHQHHHKTCNKTAKAVACQYDSDPIQQQRYRWCSHSLLQPEPAAVACNSKLPLLLVVVGCWLFYASLLFAYLCVSTGFHGRRDTGLPSTALRVRLAWCVWRAIGLALALVSAIDGVGDVAGVEEEGRKQRNPNP